MKGQGKWNTNNNLRAVLRIATKDILTSLYVESPEGGVPINNIGAAATALGPVKAMRARQDRTPQNAAEKKAIATLKNLFATCDDAEAFAKLR